MRTRVAGDGVPATMSGNASSHTAAASRAHNHRQTLPSLNTNTESFCSRDERRVRTLIAQLSGERHAGLEGYFFRHSRRELVAWLALHEVQVPCTTDVNGMRRMLVSHVVNGECVRADGVACRHALSAVRNGEGVQHLL